MTHPTATVFYAPLLSLCALHARGYSESMLYGTVKLCNYDRGFGFITGGGGKDVYFHATVVEDNAFDRIGPEQAVMFELAPKNPAAEPGQGPRAKTVKLIDELPGGILPRPPQALAPRHHPKSRQRKPTWRKKES